MNKEFRINKHKKIIEEKRERDNTRREFLLTFFKVEDNYTEKELNGFWLVKQWNGATNRWQVAIYTQESFKKYKEYKR